MEIGTLKDTPVLLANLLWQEFVATECLQSSAPYYMVSFLQLGAKYVQRNPEVSSIKSFVGIQLQRILVIGGLPAIRGCM